MPNRDLLVRQVIAAIIHRLPFSPTLLPSPLFPGWTSSSVSSVLAAIPRYLFLTPRSVARQPPSRHRSPLRQHRPPFRPLSLPSPETLSLTLAKSLEFYSWAEQSDSTFSHTEDTAKHMSILIAKSTHLPPLRRFLRSNRHLITTPTLTSVMKILGQSGQVNEALITFHRISLYHCKPDTFSYNIIISALSRIGHFKRARSLLDRMELPGAKCPPDVYTYTILIAAYCKHSLQTGCRKAVTRRIWEATHMYRRMIFRGFAPDVVTYNCLIDGLCKTYRVERAHEVFDEMLKRGCVPNRVTYNSFIRFYSAVNEADKGVEMVRVMVERGHGVATNSSYTPIVHSLCVAGRAKEAGEVFLEMVEAGNVPREYTYKMVRETLKAAGEGLPEEMCRRVEEAMGVRYTRLMRVKPSLRRRDALVEEDG